MVFFKYGCTEEMATGGNQKGTGLDDMELASAIGWLARENKIQFELQYPNGKEKKHMYILC